MNFLMKVVFLVRVPRWYSFRGDRLTGMVQQHGHEVAGILVEPVPSGKFLHDVDRKFGASMLLRKMARTGFNWLRAKGANQGGLPGTPRVFAVDSHNSAQCAALLRSLAPDVIFLRGCGIIHREILEIPKVGVLNAHFGELPKYRGVYATEWAILHGDRPLITLHFVNEGVDTGDVIATRQVPLRPGATLASVRDESSRIGGELLVDVMDVLQEGTLKAQRQGPGQGVQYFSMHPRIYAAAERKLHRLVNR